MNLNFLIFPKPKPTYSHDEKFGQLIYIPRDYRQWSITHPCISSDKVGGLFGHKREVEAFGFYDCKCIPCLYFPCPQPSTKILLYFHGNAEDVNLTQELMYTLQEELKVHIIAMEYEGYGVYKGNTNAENILRDCELLFYYVINVLKYTPNNIIIFGRSIGSGPASHLASRYPIHSLILMSAFTSLRAVVKGLIGSLLQYAIAERFVNKALMKKVNCPVFLIHGKKDGLISHKQAEELYKEIKNAVLYLAEEMDHNSFDFKVDFVTPLMEFYTREKFSFEPKDEATGLLVLPMKVFNKPAKK